MPDIDEDPKPSGDLLYQTFARPSDTNPSGDVYGGWLMSQMDLAGLMAAQEIANGRVTTVAVSNMVFIRPVPVGWTVSCFCEVLDVGRSSIKICVEVWIKQYDKNAPQKVTEGEFIYVAIDDTGRTRSVQSVPRG